MLDRNLSASALREQVFELAGGAVPVVYDAISLPDTQNAAFDLLGKDVKLLTLLAPAVDEDKQKNANGRTVVSVAGHILRPENQDFGRVLFSKLTGLLKNGDLKVCSCTLGLGRADAMFAAVARRYHTRRPCEYPYRSG